MVQHSAPKYLLKRNETYVHTNTCIQIYKAALFPVVKSWKQSKCLPTGECSSYCGICILWNAAQQQKVTNNMDQSQTKYAAQKKPNKKRVHSG